MKYKAFIVAIILLSLLRGLGAVAFQDGEKLTFNVKYGLVSAGAAVMEARSSTYQGRSVWYLSTNARTHPFFDSFFRVRDKVESWWDKDDLLSHKFSKTLQEGGYRQYRIHTYDQKNRTTTYQKWSFKNEKWITKEMALPFTTQDVLSAFYYVRNQQLTPGRKVNVNITVDGRAVDTEVLVHRREELSSIFGRIKCLVIEPRLKTEGIFKQSGSIMIWITDDGYKIPIQVQSAVTFGSFVAKLKDAKNVPYKIKYPEK